MESRLELEMLPQPDDTTCGPTCLHAVYRYFERKEPLGDVIQRVPALSGGGTLDVLLACDALRQGFDARIYSYNLTLFDPTWFALPPLEFAERLKLQMACKRDPKLRRASKAYIEFLELGGELRLEDLTLALLRKYLRRNIPILTGLSSTYLYRSMREHGPTNQDDDIQGEPAGHFVVLSGYDQEQRKVFIADPFLANPLSPNHYYAVSIERVLGAVLLGTLTYDANLLIIQPRTAAKKRGAADAPDRGR